MSKLLAVVFAATVLLAGCASKRARTEPPPDAGAQTGTTAGAEADAGAQTSGVDQADAMSGEAAAGPQEGLLARRLVYFDFDRDEIRPEDAAVISAHGRYLSGNRGMRVRLEGHTDERGTREYNIGLGERRAQAVRRALLLQGTGENQVGTVSYGEERPAAAGSDEGAYSQNRRVEIVYLQ
jgi:peptidoglycan-associated lipoprotein